MQANIAYHAKPHPRSAVGSDGKRWMVDCPVFSMPSTRLWHPSQRGRRFDQSNACSWSPEWKIACMPMTWCTWSVSGGNSPCWLSGSQQVGYVARNVRDVFVHRAVDRVVFAQALAGSAMRLASCSRLLVRTCWPLCASQYPPPWYTREGHMGCRQGVGGRVGMINGSFQSQVYLFNNVRKGKAQR
jgi:hypothetical protein